VGKEKSPEKVAVTGRRAKSERDRRPFWQKSRSPEPSRGGQIRKIKQPAVDKEPHSEDAEHSFLVVLPYRE